MIEELTPGGGGESRLGNWDVVVGARAPVTGGYIREPGVGEKCMIFHTRTMDGIFGRRARARAGSISHLAILTVTNRDGVGG